VFELRKEVARAEPFHWRTEDGPKPEPLAVKMKSEPPATPELGEIAASEGGAL
jgi:hypothetical protein